jgi:hypothetical protein
MTSLVPFVPQVSVQQILGFAERGEVITEDGEVVKVDDAANDDLVAWSLVATYLRDLARMISTSVEPELAHRIHYIGGPITATHGTARETISRASVSGIAAQRIRDILEECAADGVIPWDAVDNIAPLVPHVTPVKVANYVETCPAGLADMLEKHLPEKRRTIKVERNAIDAA